VFADEKINSVVGPLKDGLLMEQFKAIGVTIIWSVVGTAILAFLVKAVLGLRASAEVEVTGLDLAEHGEQGYEH
jgi:Amt family ammonium transporter